MSNICEIPDYSVYKCATSKITKNFEAIVTVSLNIEVKDFILIAVS